MALFIPIFPIYLKSFYKKRDSTQPLLMENYPLSPKLQVKTNCTPKLGVLNKGTHFFPHSKTSTFKIMSLEIAHEPFYSASLSPLAHHQQTTIDSTSPTQWKFKEQSHACKAFISQCIFTYHLLLASIKTNKLHNIQFFFYPFQKPATTCCKTIILHILAIPHPSIIKRTNQSHTLTKCHEEQIPTQISFASSSSKTRETKCPHYPSSMNAQLANIKHKNQTTYYFEHHMVIGFMTSIMLHQPPI